LTHSDEPHSNQEDWDNSQEKIIQAPPSERCIIDAGPGTGKTAVACARVAWLIQNGVTPGNIWIISFTRTAVREIRNRIVRYVGGGDAYSVKIATLDSHAWSIHYGFDETATKLGSYDENIEAMTTMVKENPGVTEYVRSGFEHLIIDEAQDIVGIRSDLILEIIKKLPASCGVSVFADEAQAIYGFSIDEDHADPGQKCQTTLPEKIRESLGGEFSECSLKTIFRTRDKNLIKLFTETRRKVMERAPEAYQKLETIKTEISGQAHDRTSVKIEKQEFEKPEDCFILYRRRADVLLAAGFFGLNPHRIRMSGLPVCLHSWIGACFSEYSEPTLSKSDFIDLWSKKIRVNEKSLRLAESKWSLLVNNAGKNMKIVDMVRVRQLLGRRQPPAEFCYPEIGTKGPIISTIHASKGREAKEVCLLMPGRPWKDTDFDEESRVIFVGATRSKSKFHVGWGFNNHYASRLEHSGRVYSLNIKGKSASAMVEIGRENDISSADIAGSAYYQDADIVRTHQKYLLSLAGKISPAVAVSDHGSGHIYRLKIGENGEGSDLCVLAWNGLASDLFNIGSEIKKVTGGSNRRPPDELRHLRIYGVRTLVLTPDSPECEQLLSPWSESGIMLAPVILGYPKAFFPCF
jgi:hypothetical protein